ILQNISNQMIGGVKEAFMASLNDLIVEEITKVKVFFKDLCNVLPLEHHFAMDRKIREKSPRDDLVYLSLSDLSFLKKMLWNDYLKHASHSDELMEKEYYTLIKNVCEKDPFFISSSLSKPDALAGDKNNPTHATTGADHSATIAANGSQANANGGVGGGSGSGDANANKNANAGITIAIGKAEEYDDDEMQEEEHAEANASGNTATNNKQSAESYYRYVKISVHEYMQQHERTDMKGNNGPELS
ncbi:RasGTPase-activating protein, partial [Reticulomyxa filosa]